MELYQWVAPTLVGKSPEEFNEEVLNKISNEEFKRFRKQ